MPRPPPVTSAARPERSKSSRTCTSARYSSERRSARPSRSRKIGSVLSDLRVLDCTDESGFLDGKILGDLGADGVKVEPPGGDLPRAPPRPPYIAGVADRERSLSWLALNTSKRGITLDLERPAGRVAFGRLLARTDVLLDTFAPGTLE